MGLVQSEKQLVGFVLLFLFPQTAAPAVLLRYFPAPGHRFLFPAVLPLPGIDRFGQPLIRR